jgi:ferric iron reductase protein FhuF
MIIPRVQETLTQVASLNDYLNVQLGTPEGDDWFTPAAFLEDETVLELLWTRTSAEAKTADRAYLKQSVFGSYIWLLTVSGIGTYLLARRIPDLSAENVVLHVDDKGWIDELALLTPRFACLPDDPAAEDPHATVVPDGDALRRFYLQGLLTGHLEAFMETMKSRYKYGLRAMQETMADRIAGSLIWLLKDLERKAEIRAEVEAFLALLPFSSKSGVLEVPFEGRCEPFLKRASCCMSYRLPQYGYCTSCPLQPEEERIKRFQAYLAESAHG